MTAKETHPATEMSVPTSEIAPAKEQQPSLNAEDLQSTSELMRDLDGFLAALPLPEEIAFKPLIVDGKNEVDFPEPEVVGFKSVIDGDAGVYQRSDGAIPTQTPIKATNETKNGAGSSVKSVIDGDAGVQQRNDVATPTSTTTPVKNAIKNGAGSSSAERRRRRASGATGSAAEKAAKMKQALAANRPAESTPKSLAVLMRRVISLDDNLDEGLRARMLELSFAADREAEKEARRAEMAEKTGGKTRMPALEAGDGGEKVDPVTQLVRNGR